MTVVPWRMRAKVEVLFPQEELVVSLGPEEGLEVPLGSQVAQGTVLGP